MNHLPRKFGFVVDRCEIASSLDRRGQSTAFTLVELLAVMSIIVLMFSLAVPAINGLKNSGDVNKAVYDVAGTLDQARAYAMGNSTYVYVGITEVDASVNESKVPQTPADDTKGGRIAIAVMASKDGTAPAPGENLVPSNLAPLQKIQRFENLHLADFSSSSAVNGPMAGRKPVSAAESLGNANTNEAAGVNWPIGSSGTAKQYTFFKLIRFSPQGVASLQKNTGLPAYLEIALQQTNGNIKPTVPNDLGTTNLAAIQIDGIIGSNRIYRP